MAKIKVILVDDHELFRIGTKTALGKLGDEIEVVGEAASANELFDILKTTTPDIVLLDIILPDMSGIEIAKKLRKDYPQIKIIMHSAESSSETINEIMEIGVDGFVSKTAPISDIMHAVLSVANGLEYFGSDISKIIYDIYIAKKKQVKTQTEFTSREVEIIGLCGQGMQAKEIADKLCISLRTVDTHKTNIFRKLGINSTVELVKYALKNGIISV